MVTPLPGGVRVVAPTRAWVHRTDGDGSPRAAAPSQPGCVCGSRLPAPKPQSSSSSAWFAVFSTMSAAHPCSSRLFPHRGIKASCERASSASLNAVRNLVGVIRPAHWTFVQSDCSTRSVRRSGSTPFDEGPMGSRHRVGYARGRWKICERKRQMNSIFTIIGVVVVALFVLGYFGFR